MSLPANQQFLENVDRSQRPLIVVPKEWTPDTIGAALALSWFLEKRGKKPTVVCEGFAPTKAIGFFPKLDRVKSGLGSVRPFVITLDLSRAKIDELSYDVRAGELRINVTPKAGGTFEPKDVSATNGAFTYDLIVTVGAHDLASLGKLFTDNADLFYAAPKVVIDHAAANERYGAINLVDLTAASCTEVVHGLIVAAGGASIDAETATCLMAGIIAETKSFRTPTVTPRTLEIASQLVAAGAQREEIVRLMYRTRSIATLKLWGRALARLKYDPALGLASSVLVRQDFVHAGASEKDLPDVIEELIANAPEAEIIALIHEQESPTEPGNITGVCALVATDRHGDAQKLVAALRPEGTRTLARICFPALPIVEAEKQVLQTIAAAVAKAKK